MNYYVQIIVKLQNSKDHYDMIRNTIYRIRMPERKGLKNDRTSEQAYSESFFTDHML